MSVILYTLCLDFLLLLSSLRHQPSAGCLLVNQIQDIQNIVIQVKDWEQITNTSLTCLFSLRNKATPVHRKITCSFHGNH